MLDRKGKLTMLENERLPVGLVSDWIKDAGGNPKSMAYLLKIPIARMNSLLEGKGPPVSRTILERIAKIREIPADYPLPRRYRR